MKAVIGYCMNEIKLSMLKLRTNYCCQGRSGRFIVGAFKTILVKTNHFEIVNLWIILAMFQVDDNESFYYFLHLINNLVSHEINNPSLVYWIRNCLKCNHDLVIGEFRNCLASTSVWISFAKYGHTSRMHEWMNPLRTLGIV